MAPFPETRWSLLLAGEDADSEEYREAFAYLASAYYDPILAFVRRQGRGEDAARDLTQAFLAQLLERRFLATASPDRGRFRSYVAVSLRNFLHSEVAREDAVRRSPRAGLESLDVVTDEGWLAIDVPVHVTPEQEFERRWAASLVQRAALRVRNELAAKGLEERFDLLREHVLGEPGQTYRELAASMRMTEASIKMTVSRWRRRLGSALREEVAATVVSPDMVDDELRYLLELHHEVSR